jgi:hypothetical protein
MMRRVLMLAVAGALGASTARADVLILKGGGRIEGEIVEQRPESVVVDVSAGRVTLPRARIERMVVGRSALAEFRARAGRLASGDVAGWLALAAWARESDLTTQSRGAYEHVLAVDPGNTTARRALGQVFADGRWMTADESYRARGYVQFEGSWVRPAEREALIAERASEDAHRRELMEADARVREAEARARAAEAEAERAEAGQQQPAMDNGIPYPWVFGGGIVPLTPRVRHDRRPPTVIVVQPRPQQRPAPRPTPPPRPARSSHAGLRGAAGDQRADPNAGH